MDDLAFGIVVDINDPIKAQRVKVRVVGYYDNIPEDDLPWCQVLRCGASALTFNVGTAMHNLENGSQVLVAWLDHYHQQPIVLGNVPRVMDCDHITDTSTETITTKQGHVVRMNDETVELTDNCGNHVKLDKNGILLEIPKSLSDSGNATIKIDNNTEITTTGLNITAKNCNIKCEEGVTIEAKDCTIKASGNATIDASELSLKNIKGPNQFCCLPTCLFTGGKHIAPSTDN